MTIEDLADELKASVSDVKRLLRERFADVDFSRPGRALTREQEQAVRIGLADHIAQRRRRPVDTVVAEVTRELPGRLEQVPAVLGHAPGRPRPGVGHRLRLHQEVLGYLQDPHGELRRLQAATLRLLREMLVEGRAQRRVKGTRGVNAGWLRAPLGDNGGYHYYLWHALAGMRPADGLDLGRGDVLVRAVRHHDETDQPLTAGALADYLPLDAREYVASIEEQDQAADVLSPDQRGACNHAAAHTISKGHPGAGKTTLQLERIRRYRGRILFVTFGEAQREAARRWLTTYAHPDQEVMAWTHHELFTALSPGWRPPPPLAEAADALRVALGGDRRVLGPWVGHLGALYGELRAHLWGRALPFAFRGRAPAVDDEATLAGYREARVAVLGGGAVDAAVLAARALSPEVRAALFGDLDHARRLAADLVERPLPPRLADLDAVLVDEIQDLTVVEQLVCAQLAHRPAASGLRPAFHVAGDEGQTVRATDFDWGELKSLVHDLLGRPEEFELPGNVRSPGTITRVINNSWSLYKTMAKQQRPRGYAEAEVDQSALGAVLWVELGDDGGLDRLCEVVAATPGAALVYPDTRLPDEVAAAAIRAGVVHAAAAPEIKGLDFRVAVVLDVGRRAAQLYDATGGVDEQPILELENRTAVDSIRVAISRATEVLVLAERSLDPDVRRRLEALCSEQGALLDGVVADVPLAQLRDRLDMDTGDRNELVTEALADFDRTFADDPATGLRVIERARGWLGESNRAGAVKGELRRLVYLALGRALLRVGIEDDDDARLRATLSRAIRELHHARAQDWHQLAQDARALLVDEGGARLTKAMLSLARGAEGEQARDATRVIVRRVERTLARPPVDGKEWDRALDLIEAALTLAPQVPALTAPCETLAAQACEWALAQAGKSSDGRVSRAIAAMAAPSPSLRGRAAERRGDWAEAVRWYREADALVDALRVCRAHLEDEEAALELARQIGAPDVDALERLVRIRRDLLALGPDVLTEQERQRLTALVKERLPARKR